MRPPELFDTGLQPERTRLAQRRTVLALVVASLMATRTVPPPAGVVIGVFGLVVAAVLALLAGRRARRTGLALRAGSGALPGGGLPAGFAAAVTLLGALAAVAVFVR